MRQVIYILIVLVMSGKLVLSAEVKPEDISKCIIIQKGDVYLVELSIFGGAKFDGGESAKISVTSEGNLILDIDMPLNQKKDGGYHGSFLVSRKLLLQTKMSICFGYEGHYYILHVESSVGDGEIIKPILKLTLND